MQEVSTSEEVPHIIDIDLNKVVKATNGRLHFDNIDDFNKIYQYVGNDLSRVSKIESFSNENFISFSTAYKEMTKIDFKPEDSIADFLHLGKWVNIGDERFFLKLIDNPIYAALYNENGELQIANRILKRGFNTLDIYNAEDFLASNDVQPLQRLSIERSTEIQFRSASCVGVYEWKNGNQYRRVTGHASAEIETIRDQYGNFVHQPTGFFFVTSENQKRGFGGGWNQNDADVVTLQAGSTSATEYGVSSVTRRIHGCCSSGTSHTATDKGLTGSCTT